MAETVATTAGGIVLEVVTGGRDYLEKKKSIKERTFRKEILQFREQLGIP